MTPFRKVSSQVAHFLIGRNWRPDLMAQKNYAMNVLNASAEGKHSIGHGGRTWRCIHRFQREFQSFTHSFKTLCKDVTFIIVGQPRKCSWIHSETFSSKDISFKRLFCHLIQYALAYSKKTQLWIEAKTSNLLYRYFNLADH